jgi:predicted Zn-dependent protease
VVEFQAQYYDGKSSASREVRVRAYSSEVEIVGEDVRARIPLAALKLAPPIPGTRRILQLADGAQLQTADEAAVTALFPKSSIVDILERRWPYAIASLVVVALAAWWAVVYGVPLAARVVANSAPLKVEAVLGERTLQALDAAGCAPSALSAERQNELRQLLARLTNGLGDGYPYRLELRNCQRIGANAFAMPGGTLVVTDAMVKLAQNDEQLLAVLAHEVGHVRHRHGLRLALQSLGVGALIAALAGDAASVTALAVAVPSVLLQSGYSRAFEEEADSYAFMRLKEIGVAPRHFADIMRRLEASHRRVAGDDRHVLDYLSSHPNTESRIERALSQK